MKTNNLPEHALDNLLEANTRLIIMRRVVSQFHTKTLLTMSRNTSRIFSRATSSEAYTELLRRKHRPTPTAPEYKTVDQLAAMPAPQRRAYLQG